MVNDEQKQLHAFKTRVIYRNDIAQVLIKEGDFAGFASGTHQQERAIIFTIGPSKRFNLKQIFFL